MAKHNQASDQPIVNTPQIVESTTPEEVVDVVAQPLGRKVEFPDLIGRGISGCMRERIHHQVVDRQLDEWIRNLPADKAERIKMLDDARAQMETAKMALDLFYTRFRTMAVGMRG